MPAVNPGTTNLAAWWSLNETSGNRLDSHGTNHLTVGGATSYAAGKVGNAADFESGTSDYLYVADNAALSAGNVGMTFCAWVRYETVISSSVILSKFGGTNADREYFLRVSGTTFQFGWYINATGTRVDVNETVIGAGVTSGTWYFVVAGHNATTNQTFISANAGAQNTAAATGGNDGAASFAVGAFITPANFTDGLIDEVCVYRRVLTTDEVTWLYNAGAGRAYSELSAAKGLPVIEHWHNTMYLR